MLDGMAYWKSSKFAKFLEYENSQTFCFNKVAQNETNKKHVGVFFFQKYGNFQRVSLDHFNKMYNKVWTSFFLNSEILIQ